VIVNQPAARASNPGLEPGLEESVRYERSNTPKAKVAIGRVKMNIVSFITLVA
jgi:hypothetical protein